VAPASVQAVLAAGQSQSSVMLGAYLTSQHPKEKIYDGFGCGLSGSVVAFTPQRLLQTYPTHDDYVQKYTEAADKAVAAGYELQADHDIAIQKAKAAPIPN
jgi:hypothetical protein